MKTITKNGLSLYILSDDSVVNLLDDRVEVVGEFVVGDLNSFNAVVFENVTPPEDWAGGRYFYDGSWKLNPKAAEADKLTGVEINGVMCSATKEDQNGLVAVAMEYNMKHSAGLTLADTVFKFENGNTLTITDSNFQSVYAAWAPFRQSFFTSS